MEQQSNNQKVSAPNSVSSLVLGILSLLTGCSFIGLILGIIGLVLSSKGFKAYQLNPESYNGNGMLKAGKICSIIGIVFGAIALLWGIISMIALGGSFFAMSEYLDLFDL